MTLTITHSEPRYKRRSGKTEEMRQRILEESIKLFVEQGYEKTTTRQILQNVGILNGSLYNIYKSKEDIFSDIIMMSLSEVMAEAPKHISDDTDKADTLAYLLCIEVYISNRSQRIAELLCIANENWKIRTRVNDMVARWVSVANANGSAPLDVDNPYLRLDACMGAAFVIMEKMANEPGSVDERAAMTVVVETVYALLHKVQSKAADTVGALLGSFSRSEMTIAGIRIL